MKKVLILSAVLCFNVQLGFANVADLDPFDEFANSIDITVVSKEVAKERLNNLAKDLGPVLGGGSFHRAKVLGVPGVDVGLSIPFRPVSDDNAIFKAADFTHISIPLLQAEIGLPANWDVILRYTTYGDATMTGFGVRYGIIQDSLPGIPAISVQSVYNIFDANSGVNKFDATTLTTAVVASINVAVLEPYVGISYDMTTITPDSKLGVGEKGEYSGIRIDAGANIKVIPFTYLQLGVNSAAGLMGYNFGCGIKF